jgi:oligopeptide transport system substrate-binding protein
MSFRCLCHLLLPLLLILTACHKQEVKAPPASTLRISTEGDAQTLDPRQTRDLATATIVYTLYEGLMRLNEEGQPMLAAAEDVSISNDHKTYTFTIRQSAWSNGQPVTAYDFEQTWKSVLDPKFAAPNAYQLYPIKGAKAAKEGILELDQVGIKATSPTTLVVELENPTPYFLNLVAAYFYYPVHADMRTKEGDKPKSETTITNGPFQLEEWLPQNQLTTVKNLHYWNAQNVKLGRIVFITLDNATALSLFERGELDWMGSPLSTLPTDALGTLKKEERLNQTMGAGLFLMRFNTQKAPFDQVKLREAFSLALNRQELVDHVLQGNQIPALGLVPPTFLNHPPFFRDYNLTKAQQSFKEALAAAHTSKEELPAITLCYANNERNHKIAQVAQQQWKQAFAIDVKLQSCEGKIMFEHLKNGDYQIGIGSWFADIRDPISFLEVFKYKNNGTNNTGWENPQFIQLLNLSSQTNHHLEREKLLTEAETVLIQDMPIAPLFYNTYNYLKQPHVKGVYFSELGYLDFKEASIEGAVSP